jgi:hypothetical protein
MKQCFVPKYSDFSALCSSCLKCICLGLLSDANIVLITAHPIILLFNYFSVFLSGFCLKVDGFWFIMVLKDSKDVSHS